MKIGMVSLGCPKNLVDSEVMLGIIRDKELEVTNDPAEADLIIVNTCGFIESAKEESINTVLQMGEYKTQGSCKYLIMTGCLGQRYADELFESLPEVDAIVGTDSFTDIGWVIDQVMAGKRLKHLEKLESKNVKALPRMLTTPSYMAYLKIAEGCDNCCSYCIIPQLRGPYTSRPYDEVMAEAKALAEHGTKELIVVAQDTTRYGEDLYGKLMLPQLLRDLNKLEGIQWIRVMYLYPNNFNDELIAAFAECDKVCKYIDIPLQHASDRLLDSMNRSDTRAQVEELLDKLRSRIPGITIRTTFIVGFPGETEEDFQETLRVVEEARFASAFTFIYSPRPGTPAAEMEQVPHDVVQDRFERLVALQERITEENLKTFEGRDVEVMVTGASGKKDAATHRVTGREKTGVLVHVGVPEGESMPQVGDFVTATVTHAGRHNLIADPNPEAGQTYAVRH